MKRRFVESTIEARLAEANNALSDAVLREAARYIDVIVRGGEVSLPLVGAINILGLERSRAIIDGVAAGAAAGLAASARRSTRSRASPAWPPTTSTSRKPILASIGSPVQRQADDRQGPPHAARLVRGGGRGRPSR